MKGYTPKMKYRKMRQIMQDRRDMFWQLADQQMDPERIKFRVQMGLLKQRFIPRIDPDRFAEMWDELVDPQPDDITWPELTELTKEFEKVLLKELEDGQEKAE